MSSDRAFAAVAPCFFVNAIACRREVLGLDDTRDSHLSFGVLFSEWLQPYHGEKEQKNEGKKTQKYLETLTLNILH